MCLCNQGVAKAKKAIEKVSFGGAGDKNNEIEGMMNTFYRSATVGFATGMPTFGNFNPAAAQEEDDEEEEGFDAQEYS